MKNCFFGEIVSESANEIMAEYICVPYPDEQGDSPQRFTFLIIFERNGEAFEAKLTSYYQIITNRRESALFSDTVFPDK